MIQLTDNGDKSLFLIRFDDRNLAIIKGKPTIDKNGRKKQNVIGFYGSVQEAFEKAINHAVLGSGGHAEATSVLNAINDLKQHIERACVDMPTMIALMRGE